jgi:hypothetical protein
MVVRMRRRRAEPLDRQKERWRRGAEALNRWADASWRVGRGMARHEDYPYLELAVPRRRPGDDPDADEPAGLAA